MKTHYLMNTILLTLVSQLSAAFELYTSVADDDILTYPSETFDATLTSHLVLGIGFELEDAQLYGFNHITLELDQRIYDANRHQHEPIAGYSGLSFIASAHKSQSWQQAGIHLGVTGPHTPAANIQNGWHKWRDIPPVTYWHKQIPTHFLATAFYTHKSLINPHFSADWLVSLGNLRTNVASQISWRYGDASRCYMGLSSNEFSHSIPNVHCTGWLMEIAAKAELAPYEFIYQLEGNYTAPTQQWWVAYASIALSYHATAWWLNAQIHQNTERFVDQGFIEHYGRVTLGFKF